MENLVIALHYMCKCMATVTLCFALWEKAYNFQNVLRPNMTGGMGSTPVQLSLLSQLYTCPTCNQDCQSAEKLKFHLLRHPSCLKETRCTLSKYLQRIADKKYRLTNQEKYKESHRKKVRSN